MTYITEHFGGRLPTPPRYTTTRAHAATVAKGILGDDADVYDIVTLAEFLVGEGSESVTDAMDTAGRRMMEGFVEGINSAPRTVADLLADIDREVRKLTLAQALKLHRDLTRKYYS